MPPTGLSLAHAARVYRSSSSRARKMSAKRLEASEVFVVGDALGCKTFLGCEPFLVDDALGSFVGTLAGVETVLVGDALGCEAFLGCEPFVVGDALGSFVATLSSVAKRSIGVS